MRAAPWMRAPDDLLAIGRDYDTDRVMARFAVVRRARMIAW
jgi:hypothetical protein